MKAKSLFILVAIALVALFVYQNMAVVSINFLLWEMSASRVIIYLSIFLLGVLVGWLGRVRR